MNIVPFNFGSKEVRTIIEDGQPWFVANDVCAALEFGNPRQALSSHVDPDDVHSMDTLTAGGTQTVNVINESGLYALILGSRKQSAKAFKRWVTSEVLPQIRKTGSYEHPALKSLTAIAKESRAAVSLAKAFGLKGNQAHLSADRMVRNMYSVSPLELLGHTHLIAEKQVYNITPTEIGRRGGFGSAQQVNRLLQEFGYQEADPVHRWGPTKKGQEFAIITDVGKEHSDGRPVQQLLWTEDILAAIDGELFKVAN